MRLLHATTLTMLLAATCAQAQSAEEPAGYPVVSPQWSLAEIGPAPMAMSSSPLDRLTSPLAAAERPRLTVSIPFGGHEQSVLPTSAADASAFSWSIEAWQMNTASLAHIQCSHGSVSINSWVIEDCRFVDQPLPENSVNLIQVRGQWLATPNIQIGAGLFRGEERFASNAPWQLPASTGLALLGAGDMHAPTSRQTEGMDLSLSFGIDGGRVGDFLVDLQMARFRDQASFAPFALGALADSSVAGYQRETRLGLGWRRGGFRGDIQRNHHDVPAWLRSDREQSFSSFDIELSWHVPWNASISIGASNVLDAHPGGEPATDSALDDPLERIYGRIPYVRYKQDL